LQGQAAIIPLSPTGQISADAVGLVQEILPIAMGGLGILVYRHCDGLEAMKPLTDKLLLEILSVCEIACLPRAAVQATDSQFRPLEAAEPAWAKCHGRAAVRAQDSRFRAVETRRLG
jgi:hypothetical protein